MSTKKSKSKASRLSETNRVKNTESKPEIDNIHRCPVCQKGLDPELLLGCTTKQSFVKSKKNEEFNLKKLEEEWKGRRAKRSDDEAVVAATCGELFHKACLMNYCSINSDSPPKRGARQARSKVTVKAKCCPRCKTQIMYSCHQEIDLEGHRMKGISGFDREFAADFNLNKELSTYLKNDRETADKLEKKLNDAKLQLESARIKQTQLSEILTDPPEVIDEKVKIMQKKVLAKKRMQAYIIKAQMAIECLQSESPKMMRYYLREVLKRPLDEIHEKTPIPRLLIPYLHKIAQDDYCLVALSQLIKPQVYPGTIFNVDSLLFGILKKVNPLLGRTLLKRVEELQCGVLEAYENIFPDNCLKALKSARELEEVKAAQHPVIKNADGETLSIKIMYFFNVPEKDGAAPQGASAEVLNLPLITVPSSISCLLEKGSNCQFSSTSSLGDNNGTLQIQLSTESVVKDNPPPDNANSPTENLTSHRSIQPIPVQMESMHKCIPVEENWSKIVELSSSEESVQPKQIAQTDSQESKDKADLPENILSSNAIIEHEEIKEVFTNKKSCLKMTNSLESCGNLEVSEKHSDEDSSSSETESNDDNEEWEDISQKSTPRTDSQSTSDVSSNDSKDGWIPLSPLLLSSDMPSLEHMKRVLKSQDSRPTFEEETIPPNTVGFGKLDINNVIDLEPIEEDPEELKSVKSQEEQKSKSNNSSSVSFHEILAGINESQSEADSIRDNHSNISNHNSQKEITQENNNDINPLGQNPLPAKTSASYTINKKTQNLFTPSSNIICTLFQDEDFTPLSVSNYPSTNKFLNLKQNTNASTKFLDMKENKSTKIMNLKVNTPTKFLDLKGTTRKKIEEQSDENILISVVSSENNEIVQGKSFCWKNQKFVAYGNSDYKHSSVKMPVPPSLNSSTIDRGWTDPANPIFPKFVSETDNGNNVKPESSQNQSNSNKILPPPPVGGYYSSRNVKGTISKNNPYSIRGNQSQKAYVEKFDKNHNNNNEDFRQSVFHNYPEEDNDSRQRRPIAMNSTVCRAEKDTLKFAASQKSNNNVFPNNNNNYGNEPVKFAIECETASGGKLRRKNFGNSKVIHSKGNDLDFDVEKGIASNRGLDELELQKALGRLCAKINPPSPAPVIVNKSSRKFVVHALESKVLKTSRDKLECRVKSSSKPKVLDASKSSSKPRIIKPDIIQEKYSGDLRRQKSSLHENMSPTGGPYTLNNWCTGLTISSPVKVASQLGFNIGQSNSPTSKVTHHKKNRKSNENSPRQRPF